MIEFNGIKYELIKNYKLKFDKNYLKEYITTYYKDYDYILGDYFAGRVRLKGFYESDNKKVKELNNIDNIDNYIEKYCSYDCTYFILKKCT